MTDDRVMVRTKAISNSALQMQVCHLTDKLAATKICLDQANKQHGSATNKIVSLKQDVVDLKAYEGVADELELKSGALVNTQDEMACARKGLEKRNEKIRAELKGTNHSKRNMKNHNLATKGIHSNAKARDDSFDRFVTATTSLYIATQDKVLKDAEVAAMALYLVPLHHQPNE
jgi:hypothetical protein